MVRLEDIHSPEDVKKLNKKELPELCYQLRRKMIDTVATNGGHLSSNLGTVELTVALHREFSTPRDTIVWDVGHQCYAHKLLTNRYEAFDTLRKKDGISGFPKPSESEHDAFITGHSSTSISVANGIAKAKALQGDDSFTIAVIGDGALTGGLAYEGLSNAGRSEDHLIVILNDNKMSISKNVGFVARYLGHLRAQTRYVRLKQVVSAVLSHVPLIGRPVNTALRDAKKKMKQSLFSKTSFFESMGFYYMGPVNGHNLNDLSNALQAAHLVDHPVLLHVATVKGKGCTFAEKSPDTYHGIGSFDRETGATASTGKSFSSVFGETLCQLAEEDPNVVAVTAAMIKGTCLTEFAEKYPTRFFDAGIAEGHAVTFASGMASHGILPVFAVYSTFLQRSYDQLLNDTALMNNHILLAIDRAGVVPDDGETHQGFYDVAMLRSIPNTTVFAPANFKELALRLRQGLYDAAGIVAVRYPKDGENPLLSGYEPTYDPYDYFDGKTRRLLMITYGREYGEVLAAANLCHQNGIRISLLKLNCIHPLDQAVVSIAGDYEKVVFVEEAARQGGVGEYLGYCLAEAGFSGRYIHRAIETTLGACTTAEGLQTLGLDSASLVELVRSLTKELQPAEGSHGE